MVMGKHEQISGLLGDLSFGAIEGRSDEGIDQFDQRRGLHNGIQFLKHQRCTWFKLIIQDAFGKIQPLLALMLMVALLLGMRLRGEMFVVPSQHQCISYLLRYQGTQFGMHGFSLFKRGSAIVKMGAKRLKKLR